MLTHTAVEKDLQRALSEAAALEDVLTAAPRRIRVEDFNRKD
jgi:hypothetical protein